jgi:hypothetical protein
VNRWPSITLAVAALVLLACPAPTHEGGDEDAELCEDASLDKLRAEILVPKCTGEFCHGAEQPAVDLDFTRPVADIAAQLVEVPSVVCPDWTRVVPGDPERSILFAKLHDPPPCGERMPIDAELSKREIACVARWIEELGSGL